MSDIFLGKPIVYWLELDKKVKEIGPHFERILCDALVEQARLRDEVNQLKRDWNNVFNIAAANKPKSLV